MNSGGTGYGDVEEFDSLAPSVSGTVLAESSARCNPTITGYVARFQGLMGMLLHAKLISVPGDTRANGRVNASTSASCQVMAKRPVTARAAATSGASIVTLPLHSEVLFAGLMGMLLHAKHYPRYIQHAIAGVVAAVSGISGHAGSSGQPEVSGSVAASSTSSCGVEVNRAAPIRGKNVDLLVDVIIQLWYNEGIQGSDYALEMSDSFWTVYDVETEGIVE